MRNHQAMFLYVKRVVADTDTQHTYKCKINAIFTYTYSTT